MQPWLGTGLDLSELPVPRLVVVGTRQGGALGHRGPAQKARRCHSRIEHRRPRLWLERLAVMAKSVVFVAAVIFALVLAAMILAVGFATQGTMAGNREIIEVLHFVGAEDSYISRQFQRHFFRLGLRGGAIGGGLAIFTFLRLGSCSPPGCGQPPAASRWKRCSAIFRWARISMPRSRSSRRASRSSPASCPGSSSTGICGD